MDRTPTPGLDVEFQLEGLQNYLQISVCCRGYHICCFVDTLGQFNSTVDPTSERASQGLMKTENHHHRYFIINHLKETYNHQHKYVFCQHDEVLTYKPGQSAQIQP